jgi:hypothetical protein
VGELGYEQSITAERFHMLRPGIQTNNEKKNICLEIGTAQ